MRLLFATILLILIMAGSATFAVAQNSTNVPSKPDGPVTDMFAPITASLNLTKEQEFQIIAILTSAQVTADSLKERFDEIDQELLAATYAELFDEERVRVLSDQEAEILSQLIALRVITKAKIHQILTPEQRQRILLLQHFRPKVPLQRH